MYNNIIVISIVSIVVHYIFNKNLKSAPSYGAMIARLLNYDLRSAPSTFFKEMLLDFL